MVARRCICLGELLFDIFLANGLFLGQFVEHALLILLIREFDPGFVRVLRCYLDI